MIIKAKKGIFKPYAVSKMQLQYKNKYFNYVPETNNYHLKEIIKHKVLYYQLNLMVPFPFGKVDIILCRNVMIYFNQESKQIVFNNLYSSLVDGGYLIVGYVDNFMQKQTSLHYIKPTVFKKDSHMNTGQKSVSRVAYE